MWSKISNVLKPRQGHEQDSDPTDSVMAGVYQQHPNLSVFRSTTDFSFPTSSTPRSPSKHRSRAHSDSAFRAIGRSATVPEANINDVSSPALNVYGSLDLSSFNVQATRYYTPEPAVFPLQTIPASPPDSPPASPPSKHGSRILSDTIFQSLGRSSRPPEADINDEFSSEVIVYAKPDPDPFSAHATTYYTPQTMIPPTPPKNAAKHTRKTSKEEDLIYTLRTQLALQTELCQQYEVDLRARDELVEALGNRLDFSEKEGERRKGVLKGWKKKVAELERACRHLEEEVDNSRQESVERSIMDEASGEALRMLHRQIAGLEREKSDAERREAALKDEVATLGGLVKERSDDLQRMNEALWNRDESERALKEGIKDAKEQMEMMGNISIGGDEELRALVVKTEQANEEQKDRYRTAESEWEEQRAELSTKVEMLLEDKAASVKELAEVKMILQTREEEHKVLKMELEAQWKHTENASEKIAELEKEKRIIEEEKVALKSDVDILEEKIGALEVEWTEAENRRAGLEADLQELWGDREALEEEKSVLEEQIKNEREHAEELTHALQEREDRVAELDQQRLYALDNISRLEENVRQRDAEVAEYSGRVIEREADAEQLREEMSKMKRDHARTLDEQIRALQDTVGQEGETRQRMELLVKEKAAGDIELSTLKDRVAALKEEIERLRRQVHELQQESADKEVKIVQITKQREKDKEDLQGLNIALDSKQQELELLKRRLGVRGTGGSTPVPSSKVTHQRRDSVAFSTPGISRPPSVMSDSGKESVSGKDRKTPDTPSTVAKSVTLGKSVRANLGLTTVSGKVGRGIDGSMGPPPARSRVSIGTPTPMGRVPSIEARLSSRAAQLATTIHPRVSSSTLRTSRSGVNPSPAPSSSNADEKENLDVSLKRQSLIPIPS